MSAEAQSFASVARRVHIQTDADESTAKRLIGKRALFEGFGEFMILPEVVEENEFVRHMRTVLVDQDPAIKVIGEAMDRIEGRDAADQRPIANFAFLGPTGVGKSEAGRSLAVARNPDDPNLIKIECSKYEHGHEITELVGSPKSYVGYGEEAVLDKDSVEKPGTVILFDEIERGSQALYNLMLHIMDDGEIRLNNGKIVSFRDAVIVLTSNLGAREMASATADVKLGFGSKEQVTDNAALEKIALREFANRFTPEFIGRLTERVVFHPLSRDGLSKVLDIKLRKVNEGFREEYGTHLSLSEAMKESLVAEAAQIPHLGARPLIRALDSVQAEFGRQRRVDMIPDGSAVRAFHVTELPEDIRESYEGSIVLAVKEAPEYKRPRRIPVEQRAITSGAGMEEGAEEE